MAETLSSYREIPEKEKPKSTPTDTIYVPTKLPSSISQWWGVEQRKAEEALARDMSILEASGTSLKKWDVSWVETPKSMSIKTYQESIALFLKNIAIINAQYTDRTGLIGKAQDWLWEKTGAWGSSELIYKDTVARQVREAQHLYTLITADKDKIWPIATNALIDQLNKALPSLKLQPISLVDAAVRSMKTAGNTANGWVEGVYSSIEGVITGSIDLAKFTYKYSESWIGNDASYKNKIDQQMKTVWDYIDKTHSSKVWKDISGVISKEMDRINTLPESERAFAIGNIWGKIIGMLAIMKAGSVVATHVWEMWGKVSQAGRIGERLALQGQAGSARAERVAELGRQAGRAKYGARGLDIAMNGIAESVIGLALMSSIKSIKILLLSKTAASWEKLKALESWIEQTKTELRTATSEDQRKALEEVQKALEVEKKKLSEATSDLGTPKEVKQEPRRIDIPGEQGTVGTRRRAANDEYLWSEATPLPARQEVPQVQEVRQVANGAPIVSGNPYEVRARFADDTTISPIWHWVASVSDIGSRWASRHPTDTPDRTNRGNPSERVPNMNPHNLEVGSEIIKGDRTLTIESIRGDTIRFRWIDKDLSLVSFNQQIDGTTIRIIQPNRHMLETWSLLIVNGKSIRVIKVQDGFVYYDWGNKPLSDINKAIDSNRISLKHPEKWGGSTIKPLEPLPDFAGDYSHLARYDADRYYANLWHIDAGIPTIARQIEEATHDVKFYGTDAWKDTSTWAEMLASAQRKLRESQARLKYLESLKADLRRQHEEARTEAFAVIERAKSKERLIHTQESEIINIWSTIKYSQNPAHQQTLDAIKKPDMSGIGRINPEDVSILWNLTWRIEGEVNGLKKQKQALLEKYKTSKEPNIQEVLKETLTIIDTRIKGLEDIRQQAEERIRGIRTAQEAKDRLIQSLEQSNRMRGSPENIARIEWELIVKRAKLESINQTLSSQASALQVDRTRIENNLPTAEVFEGGLNRGRAYSIDANSLADGRRSSSPLIDGLVQEINTLEEELRRARNIQS